MGETGGAARGTEFPPPELGPFFIGLTMVVIGAILLRLLPLVAGLLDKPQRRWDPTRLFFTIAGYLFPFHLTGTGALHMVLAVYHVARNACSVALVSVTLHGVLWLGGTLILRKVLRSDFKFRELLEGTAIRPGVLKDEKETKEDKKDK